MSLLVVGSVALDSIHSPAGEAPEVLGGSAVHFSIAASFFHPVRLVGVIGDDFPEPFVEVLRGRDVDLRGLERGEGKSFRWTGRYEGSMASAETLSVELNLFGTFDPKVPEAFRDSRFVFLANGSPTVQRKVLEQVNPAAFTLMDTMNLWIEIEHQGLLDVLAGVGALVINDGELRQLTGQKNLLLAGKSVLAMGPRIVIVKKGEHGALAFMGDQVFAAPAYPVTDVKDPTGAGDSFAGGFLGTLACLGNSRPSFEDVKRAVCVGIVTASFNVEDFATERLCGVAGGEILERYRAYHRMLAVDGEPILRENPIPA